MEVGREGGGLGRVAIPGRVVTRIMSEPYQLACLRVVGWPVEETLGRVHGLLKSNDIRLDSDSLLVLHDSGVVEPEPEHVNEDDEEDVLRRLVMWPTLGTVDLCGSEGMVSVSYLGWREDPGLQCVLISAMERAVDRTGSVPRYQALGRSLHETLVADRTVMRWGLEMSGFGWQEEVERIAGGQFVGEYELLDLRRTLR